MRAFLLEHKVLNVIQIVNLTKYIEVPVTANFTENRWKMAAQKILVWRITSLKKVVFLDADFVFIKNPDYVFNLSTLVGMRDDCGNKEIKLNSGFFSLFPSTSTFDELMILFARPGGWPNGDQQLIYYYFKTRGLTLLPETHYFLPWCCEFYNTPDVRGVHFTFSRLDVNRHLLSPEYQFSGRVSPEEQNCTYPFFELWRNSYLRANEQLK